MAEKLASQTDRPAASAPETPLQLSPSQQSVVQEDISPVVLRILQMLATPSGAHMSALFEQFFTVNSKEPAPRIAISPFMVIHLSIPKGHSMTSGAVQGFPESPASAGRLVHTSHFNASAHGSNTTSKQSSSEFMVTLSTSIVCGKIQIGEWRQLPI